MSSEIVEFLRARYDELEAKAQATVPGPWHVARNGLDVHAEDLVVVENFDEPGPWLRALPEHIVANDPQFVLADLAAKRLLLDLHKKCAAQCYVVRVLAAPFTGHPEFRDEWRVM